KDPALSAARQQPHLRNQLHAEAGEILVTLALHQARADAVQEAFFVARALPSHPQLDRDRLPEQIFERDGSGVFRNQVQLKMKKLGNVFIGAESDQGQDMRPERRLNGDGPVLLSNGRHRWLSTSSLVLSA